jgi:hypothetical protein
MHKAWKIRKKRGKVQLLCINRRLVGEKGGAARLKYNFTVISQPGFGLNTIALFFPEIPNSTLLRLIFLMQIAERQKTLDQGIKAHFFRVFRAFRGLKTF